MINSTIDPLLLAAEKPILYIPFLHNSERKVLPRCECAEGAAGFIPLASSGRKIIRPGTPAEIGRPGPICHGSGHYSTQLCIGF